MKNMGIPRHPPPHLQLCLGVMLSRPPLMVSWIRAAVRNLSGQPSGRPRTVNRNPHPSQGHVFAVSSDARTPGIALAAPHAAELLPDQLLHFRIHRYPMHRQGFCS